MTTWSCGAHLNLIKDLRNGKSHQNLIISSEVNMVLSFFFFSDISFVYVSVVSSLAGYSTIESSEDLRAVWHNCYEPIKRYRGDTTITAEV